MNPKKILIIDDNEIILKTLTLKLEASGFEVMTALDGSQGVAAVRQHRPDLILLDISFPPDVAHGGGVPWDGFRIIQWLRRMEEAKDTPIVIITGTEGPEHRKRALAAGAFAFLQKPIDHHELLTAIEQALQLSPAASKAGR